MHDSTRIYRLVGALQGGTAVVGFTTEPVAAVILDPVSDTLFASPDGDSIVAWENASTATGLDNPSTWLFNVSSQPNAFALGSDRLFAATQAGPVGGTVMQIWNSISSITGPAEALPNETLSTLSESASYRSLVVTDDDALVAVYYPGVLGPSESSRELHVFAGASTMTAATVPTVLVDVLFDGLENVSVSCSGDLFGCADAGIVVVPTVTSPSGDPFAMTYDCRDTSLVD